MNALALALILFAQAEPPADRPADQPASQPAEAPAQIQLGGTGADVAGTLTWIYEIDEEVLHVQESWQLENTSGRLVEKDQLHFPLPARTRRVNLDKDVTGFAAAEDASEIYATEALGQGTKTVSGAYMVDFDGDSAVIRRTLPVRTTSARLIVENVDGLEITSNIQLDKRVRDLNGLEFQVITMAPIPAGGQVELHFDGLPSHITWPRRAALLVVIAIVGWMFWALQQPRSELASKIGPLSAQSRRDRIVRAIEILERDYSEDKIKEKRYERRHEELMTELAHVLREIDLAKSSE